MAESGRSINFGTIGTVLGIMGVLCGYGIWVGSISQRVSVVERRQDKYESTIELKLDTLTDTINKLNVQVAELTKEVQFLKEKD